MRRPEVLNVHDCFTAGQLAEWRLAAPPCDGISQDASHHFVIANGVLAHARMAEPT